MTAGSSPRLHERVFDILAGRIARGALSAGAPLSETAVAAHFGISRAPARRALVDLERAGMLARSPSRGYVVRGGEGASGPDSTAGLRGGDQRLVSLPSWERIYGEVESEIIARISFASWRLNEAELARHHGVSRTVARDVIGRLQQSGVVRKDDRSRWFAPALTPAHVGELYELRWLLEPVALSKALPRLPAGLVVEMRAGLLAEYDNAIEVQGATLDRLEHELHVALLGHCGSASLMQALALPQSLLIAHRFLYLWTPKMFSVEPLFPEHLEILDGMIEGRAEAAAAALERHLKLSHERALARIEVIKRAQPPESLAYLDRMPAG